MSGLSPALSIVRQQQVAGLQLHRAWPGPDGSLSFEGLDELGRIRAGWVRREGKVSLLAYGLDPKLPALGPALAASGARLLVHRPAKRAVLLGAEQVTKFVRPSKVSALALASEAMGSRVQQAGFRRASLLSLGEGQLVFELLPGQTLQDLGDSSLEGWKAFAASYRNLQQGGFSAEADPCLEGPWGSLSLKLHGPLAELAVLEHWFAQARAYGSLEQVDPGLKLLSACLSRLAGALEGLGQVGRVSLLHRDLHDKQLLWDGRDLSLLDLDTAAAGDPELDLGNLMAHLQLRVFQGLLSAEVSQQVQGLLLSLALDLGLDLGRLALYQQAAQLRIMCLYSLRPASASWLPAWLDFLLGQAGREPGEF
ncbi:MAG: phosphotransferase [Rothia sp. (in: high G+C Gram-positive bacteria)]|nr:phosphotransferase [Rothia sp. (in: high G+C Gram-positive bacteria)]